MWLSLLAVLAGFALLTWGADRFVTGAAATARNLGVSPLVIGLTVVGLGTSAPEILVSAVAAWEGAPGLAVGNAIGSNIANVGMVLGATALITPLTVHSETLRREFPILFAIMLVALALLLDGYLGRADGLILLGGLALMFYWMVSLGLRERADPLGREYEDELPRPMSVAQGLAWLILGLAVLLISSRMLVWGAVNIAHWIGVSDLAIGLTVVALGTSLPELATSVMSAVKNEHDIAIGNVLGSNMFNLLAVLGLPGLIEPHSTSPEVLSRDFPVMIGLSIALFAMAYGFRHPGRITRPEGGFLLACYAGYIGLVYIHMNGQIA
jgi:cation:H+ antiporter